MDPKNNIVNPETEENFARALGERLRALRGHRSQAEFARDLGVAVNSVGRYERGESTPDAAFLKRIYEVTGADPLIVMGIKAAELDEITRTATQRHPVLGEPGREFENDSPPLPPVHGHAHKVQDTGSTALPDRETLKACIEALEETDRYPRLSAEAKARAIVALYEIVKLTDVEPRQAVKGSACARGTR